MKGNVFHKLTVCVLAAGAVCLLTAGVASARGNWADDLANAVRPYAYVNAYDLNTLREPWRPYVDQIKKVQQVVRQGDQMAIRNEMGKLFEMLRTRAHGILGKHADDLYQLAVRVTPLEQYAISVPEFPISDATACGIGASIVNGGSFKNYGRWCDESIVPHAEHGITLSGALR